MVKHPQPAPSDIDVRRTASEIFVLGFPLLLMDAIRGAHPITPHRFSSFAARASELIPGLFLDDADCIHTTAVVDLATGPAVLHVPYAYGRYVSVTLIDAAGEAFASVGTQTMEHSNTDVVIAGPTWRGECPSDVRAVRSPTDLVWAVSRIIAHSAADRPKVRALAARQCLSALMDKCAAETTPCTGPAPELDQLDLSILRDLSAMDPRVVMHRLPQLIERTPATVRRQMRETAAKRLADLASLPGDDAGVQAAMRAGFMDGWRSIQEAQHALESTRSWTRTDTAPPQEIGSRSRAALALMRLGGPLRQDILTLSCEEDESGRPLSSGEEYRIRFPHNELPPASAGWRLTAHSTAQQSAGSVICDHSPLTVAPDGSIEIQIQREAPKSGGSNWLRAPEGAFMLTLRLYAPAQEAVDGRWRVAPVERLGSRVDPQPTGQRRTTHRRPPEGPSSFRTLPSAWRSSI